MSRSPAKAIRRPVVFVDGLECWVLGQSIKCRGDQKADLLGALVPGRFPPKANPLRDYLVQLSLS
jgi:hypothetical protein